MDMCFLKIIFLIMDTVKNSVRNVVVADVHLMMFISHKNLFSKK